jgi:hypothetical protein
MKTKDSHVDLVGQSDGTGYQPTDSRGRFGLSINITAAERLGRVTLGVAAVIAGVILLASPRSTLGVVLEVLLVAAGLDLVVTGALGHCPLYQRLSHVPKSLGREA